MGGAIFVLFCLCYFVTVTTPHEFEPRNGYRTEAEDNNPIFGFPHPDDSRCVPGECKVGIKSLHKDCQKLRLTDILHAKSWYKITDSSSIIQFPFAKEIPWLDQTIQNGQFYYAIDQFESKFLILFATWSKAVKGKIGPALAEAFSVYPFVTNKEYVALHNAWNDAVIALKTPQYFGNPTQYPDFTDHFDNEYWKTDEAFVQRRLAGECPYLLKKVFRNGCNGISFEKLKDVVNLGVLEALQFSVSNRKQISLYKAIAEERLFVLYLPDMKDVKVTPDLLENPNDTLIMEPIKTQITFFILKNDGELAVAAIQVNDKTDSKVLTPASDADEWQMAKTEVELTTHSFCQAKLHLGGIHWVTTVYCLTFRRHLSTKHPLYDFFKYHCEGTIPQISLTYSVLTDPKQEGNLFYAIGSKGFLQLSKKEYDERNYETFTYDNLIKGHGLDDSRIRYYPFRDDAKVILREYEFFANELVYRYYGRFRLSIKNDKELQSWVAELSAEKGGKGNMIGFPPRFNSRQQLKTFIKRFIWNNLFHASVNYALAPDFLPSSPSKLYKSTTSTPATIFQSLIGGRAAAGLTIFRGLLSNFRINRIFQYFSKLSHPTLRGIVRKYYYRLHRCVQRVLSRRNAERKARNQLGYQFIEPKWLTNSIHI